MFASTIRLLTAMDFGDDTSDCLLSLPGVGNPPKSPLVPFVPEAKPVLTPEDLGNTQRCSIVLEVPARRSLGEAISATIEAKTLVVEHKGLSDEVFAVS